MSGAIAIVLCSLSSAGLLFVYMCAGTFGVFIHLYIVFKLYIILYIIYVKGEGKAVPSQAWNDPEGSRKLRFPDFMTTAQDGDKVI